MTTLAAQKIRHFESTPGPSYQDYPVTASDIIYEGAAVTLNASGNAKPLAAADAGPFVGFAVATADNAAGAAGAINVRVQSRGVVHLPVTSADATDIGVDVYGTDDDLFSFVTTSQKKVGTIVRYVTGTTVAVNIVPTIGLTT